MSADTKKRSFSEVSSQPGIDSRPTKISKTISTGQIIQATPSVAPLVTNGVDTTSWKTVPCKNFSNTGYCAYGAVCRFMHGMADYKGGAGNGNVEYQQSTNAGYKAVPCQRYSLLGSCNLGATCQFQHGNVQTIGGTGNAAEKPYKTVPCRHFSMTGNCSYGQMCQFFHGREQARNPAYKTQICENWKNTGTCSYEGVCQFLHGQQDTVAGGTVMMGQNSTAVQGNAQIPWAIPTWQPPPPSMNPYAFYQQNSTQYPVGTLPQTTLGGFPNKQVSKIPSNYKTAMCRHYARNGHCVRGDGCLFAHREDQLGSHPNYKTVACRNWTTTGSCSYAQSCQFKHPGID